MNEDLPANNPPNNPPGNPPGNPSNYPEDERDESNPGIAPRPNIGEYAPTGKAVQKTIKVLIADDHPLVRDGIKQCINDTPGMKVVGEAGSALDVLNFLGRSHCDVLVLDIGLPDQSGLEVMRILKKSHPNLPVLILTMFPEDQFAHYCLVAGAAKYLHKSNASTELVAAIREVTRDGYRVTPPAGGKPAADQGAGAAPLPHIALTGREFHIFCHLAAGRTRQEIASDLGLSLKDVRVIRAHIFKVMGMTRNAEIVAYVRIHHLCS